MCGIIAVLRRPSDRTPPDLRLEVARPAAGPPRRDLPEVWAAIEGGSPRRRPRSPATASPGASSRSTPCSVAPPAPPPCSPSPPASRGSRSKRRPSPPTSPASSTARAPSTSGTAARHHRRPRGRERRGPPGEGRGLGRRSATGCEPHGRSSTWSAPTSVPRPSRATSPSSRRSRPSTGSRSGAATPPACTCSCTATTSTSTSGGGRRARRPGRRPALRVRFGAHARRPPGLRLQGGGRDRRAGRQHRRPARRHPPGRAPAALSAGRVAGPGRSCSATPAGPASASSPSPTPTPSAPTRPTRPDAPVRRRRAQRRRRQLRRPARRRRRSRSRRRSPPTPRSSPRSAPAAWPRAPTADEAFRRTVAGLEGSVAIGARRPPSPGTVHLALRGSGQALYVGLADDAYLVASEPYGLVEETATYLRMDGETPANPENPTASRGQIVRLDGAGPGRSRASSGSPTTAPRCRSRDDDLATAEITTRDIDRGDFPHFLLKEMSEAPASFRKTLRGRLVDDATAALAVSSSAPRRSARRPARPAARPARSATCSSSARARRRSPARAWRLPWPTLVAGTARAGRGPRSPPSCPASGCAPT